MKLTADEQAELDYLVSFARDLEDKNLERAIRRQHKLDLAERERLKAQEG